MGKVQVWFIVDIMMLNIIISTLGGHLVRSMAIRAVAILEDTLTGLSEIWMFESIRLSHISFQLL